MTIERNWADSTYTTVMGPALERELTEVKKQRDDAISLSDFHLAEALKCAHQRDDARKLAEEWCAYANAWENRRWPDEEPEIESPPWPLPWESK